MSGGLNITKPMPFERENAGHVMGGSFQGNNPVISDVVIGGKNSIILGENFEVIKQKPLALAASPLSRDDELSQALKGNLSFEGIEKVIQGKESVLDKNTKQWVVRQNTNISIKGEVYKLFEVSGYQYTDKNKNVKYRTIELFKDAQSKDPVLQIKVYSNREISALTAKTLTDDERIILYAAIRYFFKADPLVFLENLFKKAGLSHEMVKPAIDNLRLGWSKEEDNKGTSIWRRSTAPLAIEMIPSSKNHESDSIYFTLNMMTIDKKNNIYKIAFFNNADLDAGLSIYLFEKKRTAFGFGEKFKFWEMINNPDTDKRSNTDQIQAKIVEAVMTELGGSIDSAYNEFHNKLLKALNKKDVVASPLDVEEMKQDINAILSPKRYPSRDRFLGFDFLTALNKDFSDVKGKLNSDKAVIGWLKSTIAELNNPVGRYISTTKNTQDDEVYSRTTKELEIDYNSLLDAYLKNEAKITKEFIENKEGARNEFDPLEGSSASPLTAGQKKIMELINSILGLLKTSGVSFDKDKIISRLSGKISDKVKSIIAEITDEKTVAVNKSINTLIGDSLLTLEIIARLEEYFGVYFDEDEEIKKYFEKSVKEIGEDLQERMGINTIMSDKSGKEIFSAMKKIVSADTNKYFSNKILIDLLKQICMVGIEDLLNKAPKGDVPIVIEKNIKDGKIGDAAYELGQVFLRAEDYKNAGACNLIGNAWRSAAASPLSGVQPNPAVKENAVAAGFTKGGIDLTSRTVHLKLERIGSFADLEKIVLPELSNVEAIDLDNEYKQIQAMASSAIRPSDMRILEFITACYYRQEFTQRLSEITACLKEAHTLDEREGKESSETLRLATVLPDVLYANSLN